MAEELPKPVVSPDAYDRDYYVSTCLGATEWSDSAGAEVAGIYPGFLVAAGMKEGDVVIDVGTGRGELLAVAVERGASRAIGIEYAPAAVELAQRTIEVHGVGERAEVHLADARAMPVDDETGDLVTLVDVVEHLAPEELARTLSEARRVLKPGGRVVVHTMPNRAIYEVTYRIQRGFHPRRRRRWPADPRNEFEHRMHVNEQTAGSLRRALRSAGFKPARAWLGNLVYADFVPDERARVLYHRLAAHRPTRWLGAGDVWGEGVKPAS